ncbi:unnamed protein product [Didymodactylos carnosus]|uniref:Uncharacterized protein n=1 Tax=Didymodactylos carnosus TaxID=1234261 RepID=A0A813QYD0_9BILA|nr:unnamed protein product [Didymodactylos carnosus]CAF3556701.1 unnamed protein product [Didymodactylos carnosus]
MSRKVWSFVNKYLQKDNLDVYLNHNKVSKFRTENVKDGIKVTYRCSSCRKYPESSFQVRVLFNSQNEIIVSTSDTHNHKKRADTTRAPTPVQKPCTETSPCTFVSFCHAPVCNRAQKCQKIF